MAKASGTGSLRRVLQVALSVLVTALFVWWLTPKHQAGDIADALLATRPELATLALLLVVAGQWSRGWRLALLVAPHGWASFRIYRISVIHNFLASIIPARLGEISLIVLLRRHYAVPAAAGTGILIGIRVLDLLLLTAVGGITGWLVLPKDGELGWLVATCGLAGMGSALGFLLLPYIAPALSRLFEALHTRRNHLLTSIPTRVLASYAGLSRSRIAGLQIATGAIWLSLLACYHLCAVAVGATAGLGASLVASVAASYAFVSPVNGIAQVGPFEAAWTYVAMAAGEGYTVALATAVLVHLLTLLGGAAQAAIVLPFGSRPASLG